MVRAQLFSAAAVAAFCFGASSSPPTGLEPNNVEEPNEIVSETIAMMEATDTVQGRQDEETVEEDVTIDSGCAKSKKAKITWS